MSINGRSPGSTGRGSISIITLLIALPKLLLLPSLAGAFFAPIGCVLSTARNSASTVAAPSKKSKPASVRGFINNNNNENDDEYQGRATPSSRLFAATGPDDMSPPDASAPKSSIDGVPTPPLSPTGESSGTTGDVTGPVGSPPTPEAAQAEPELINVKEAEMGGGTRDGKTSVAAVTDTAGLWNLPNVLTMARVVAIPIFATIFYASLPQRNVWCASIFAGAAFTDWLDGYIARKQGIVTAFGAFLDPVADKLMVSTALILLSERLGPWMTVCSVIILCRELAISALREWMAQLGLRETVKVGNAGKWKTATQMIALSMLLLLEPGAKVTLVNPAVFLPLAKGLMFISTVLTITSGSGYLKAAWPTLMGRTGKQDN